MLGSLPIKRLAKTGCTGPYYGAKHGTTSVVVTKLIDDIIGHVQPQVRPCQGEQVHSGCQIALKKIFNGSVKWRTPKKEKEYQI
jgi:hypothetical protein